jgi:hypothetical protein
MKHALKVFGESGLEEALDEFLLWPDGDTLDEALKPHEPLFYPWFLFNWIYEADTANLVLDVPEDMTIAESYAAHRGNRLDPLETRLIEATSKQPYSFYEVVACRPGRGYRLKDVLRGNAIDVLEKMGSENAQKGDMLIARVVQIDSVAMLVGCGTILIPPKLKPTLITFRKWLLDGVDTITSETLYDYDIEIRKLYFDIYNSLMQPLSLQNTDGDPLIFHTIYYEIDSPEPVFERLKSLSVVESEEKLRSDAEFDDAGRITRVTIPWSRKGHKKSRALDNTVLGRLHLDGRRLEVEVNSARRAETIRKEIEFRLGKHAEYKTTEIQSPEAMVEAMEDREEQNPRRGVEQDELMQIPEVREHIEKTLSAHWKGWIDDKIPALNGKTPRQAVKTPDGRESVEALLLDAERHMATDAQTGDIGQTAIEDVRRRLGLDKPASTLIRKSGEGKNAERVNAIKSMIEDFGRTRLNPTYTGMAVKLCDKIARMRKLSIQRGRIEIWAAAIVHVIARLNFLFDPENDVNITADDLCAFFGTKKTTVSSKAGLIQKNCDLYFGDEEFSSPELADMFRLYETEEGVLVPGFIFNDPGKQHRSRDKTQPTLTPRGTVKKKHPRQTAPEKNLSREKVQKKSDDRQLKLFDDD